jgi:cytochrome b subunit of formate dehydrogenase
MLKGWVSEAWAARTAPGWLGEKNALLERNEVP